MIQRKQSLFLLLAIVLLLAGVVVTTAEFRDEQGRLAFELSNVQLTEFVYKEVYSDASGNTAIGRKCVSNLYGVSGILLLAAAVMAGVAIAKFKNRKLQIKMCRISIFVLLVYCVVRASSIIAMSNKLNLDCSLNLLELMPLLAIVLIFMAKAAIGKDDELVRAADRIR